MGSRGPVPKRSAQRRRKNKPEGPDITRAVGADVVEVPEPDEDWHPIARRWFDSLVRSGQSTFYEPSDWSTAVFLAESLSRDLKPQVVGITEDGDVVRAAIPLKGASLAAYMKAMAALLTTEGERRRARLELERHQGEESADVVDADVWRRRLEARQSS